MVSHRQYRLSVECRILTVPLYRASDIARAINLTAIFFLMSALACIHDSLPVFLPRAGQHASIDRFHKLKKFSDAESL